MAQLLVTKGPEKAKSGGGSKLHFTFQFTSTFQNSIASADHFFDECRTLCEQLEHHGVGHGKAVAIVSQFPPSFLKSKFGQALNAEELQQRIVL